MTCSVFPGPKLRRCWLAVTDFSSFGGGPRRPRVCFCFFMMHETPRNVRRSANVRIRLAKAMYSSCTADGPRQRKPKLLPVQPYGPYGLHAELPVGAA